MALTKSQTDAVTALLAGLTGLGVSAVTHHHLSSRGFSQAAAALFGNAAGIGVTAVSHYELKKHLEDNPHHIVT